MIHKEAVVLKPSWYPLTSSRPLAKVEAGLATSGEPPRQDTGYWLSVLCGQGPRLSDILWTQEAGVQRWEPRTHKFNHVLEI